MPVAKMVEVEAKFGCPLIELWGMTELGGLGTTFASNGPIKHGSIGVALPYVEAKIADADDAGKTLPAGEIGELMIKGGLVMQGYYGNDQATQETIEPDGWLHTGDVASMDEDGCIFIVDRKKDMILTAGFNVYPAELERVIAGHPMSRSGPSAVFPTKRRENLLRPTSCRKPVRRQRSMTSSRFAASTLRPTRCRGPCSSSTTCLKPAPAR